MWSLTLSSSLHPIQEQLVCWKMHHLSYPTSLLTQGRLGLAALHMPDSTLSNHWQCLQYLCPWVVLHFVEAGEQSTHKKTQHRKIKLVKQSAAMSRITSFKIIRNWLRPSDFFISPDCTTHSIGCFESWLSSTEKTPNWKLKLIIKTGEPINPYTSKIPIPGL